jgi:SET family sugar efflux transporter-like MFS transporter
MNLLIYKRIIRAEYGLSLGMCILVQGILMAVIVPMLPILLSNRIGMDKSEVTIFFLINILVGIVVTLGTGYLSDSTIARYKLVLVSGVLGSLGALAIATATQPIHAYVSAAISISTAVMFPQLFAVARTRVLADWEHEAQVMGITALRTLFSLGFVLGTGLASWLAQAVDIRTVFFLVAGASLGLTVYAGFTLYRIEGAIVEQAKRPSAPTDSESPGIQRAVLPLYALVVPLIALTVLQGAESTRRVFLPLVMFQLFNDASIAPLMFGIAAAVELVTMGLMGYLASKIGEKNAIAIGALTGAAYSFILSFAQSLPVLYLANVLWAVFVAALLGVAMAYIQGLLSHRAGMGGSLYVVTLNVGSLVGILAPLLVTGYDPSIFIIAAVLCLAGAALLMMGDRTAQIERRLRAAAAQEPVAQTALPVAADGEA